MDLTRLQSSWSHKDHTMWERDKPHSYRTSPQPRWRTTPSSSWKQQRRWRWRWRRWRWLRGQFPVPARYRNRTFWPPKRSFVAAEHGDVFGSFVNCVRVYSAGAIYGPKGSFRRFPRPPHVASARPDLNLGQPTCRASPGGIRTPMEMNLLYKTCGEKFPATVATRIFPFDVVFRTERDNIWK